MEIEYSWRIFTWEFGFSAQHMGFSRSLSFFICAYFCDLRLSLHCPLYALALKYLHITISPQQCLCKISFILTHTWLWCHIFCVCHICYGSTPACDSIPIPIHPTFSTAVILPSEMAFFFINGGLRQPWISLDSYGPDHLNCQNGKSDNTWQLQRLHQAHQLYCIVGIFYSWNLIRFL